MDIRIENNQLIITDAVSGEETVVNTNVSADNSSAAFDE